MDSEWAMIVTSTRRHRNGCGAGLGPGMSEAMPGFTPPTSRVRLSFIGAMEEFRAEGRGAATDDTMLGREIREFGLDWQDPERFEAYVAHLRDQARAGRAPPSRVRALDHPVVGGRGRVPGPPGHPAPAHAAAHRPRRPYRLRRETLGPPAGARHGHAGRRAAGGALAGHRPGPGHLRRVQHGLAPGDRGQRRRAGGQARQRTALLGPDGPGPAGQGRTAGVTGPGA